MRVLHTCESFSLTSETFVYDLITELEKKQDVENHILTLNRANAEERPFPRVHVVQRPALKHPLRRMYRLGEIMGLRMKGTAAWPQLRSRFQDVVQRVRPDVIHAQFGPMGVLMDPVARGAGVPLLVSFHGYDVSKLLRKQRWVDAYETLFRNGAYAHAVSNHIANKLYGLGAPDDVVRVIYNGIRVDQFDFDPEDPSAEGSEIRCLHVGRLVEKKAPVKLLEAFRHAQDQLGDRRDLRLTVAGDGPMEADVRAAVERLNLGNRVDLRGSVPHAEVARLMKAAHVYTQHCQTASDGDQEGMGVTFAEASATGRPVVSTRHNGIPDVVLHEETGFLAEEGNAREMGAYIVQLALNSSQRREMGRNGRQHVETNLRLETQVGKMDNYYGFLSGCSAS